MGRLGCSWSVTKSVTKQKAKPEKFFSENFVLSRNQETSFWILTRATPLVAPKMVILRQNETQRQCLGLPSLPCEVFLLLPPQSVRADGRTYVDVITKFSAIDRFPYSFTYLRYGAPLRALRVRGRSAITGRARGTRASSIFCPSP